MELTDYIQLGATFLIAVILANGIVKALEVAIVKRTAKNGDGPEGYAFRTLEELKAIHSQQKLSNENHLDHIEKAINEGNGKLLKEINDGNRQMIQLLGEIKGKL